MQRRLAALTCLTLAAGGVAFAIGSGGGSQEAPAAVAAKAKTKPKLGPPPELPRGGRRLFPRHRIVAYYGAPGNVELGVLGIGTPEQAARKLLAQVREYRRGGRKLLPALELITAVAARGAQLDNSYNHKQSYAVVKHYLQAARKIKGLLVLDFQPGHADFLPLIKHYSRFLREPDVMVALDPEWHTPGAVPGTVIGSTDAATVNGVSRYLQKIVRKYRLPDKMLLVHQFTDTMIRNKQQLKPLRHVPLVLNVDGFGTQPVKIAKYHDFTNPPVRHVHDGFKLFFNEDTETMTPAQVLELRPRPDVVTYE
jgi:hypothetical protein